MKRKPKIVIIGGGPGGAAAASFLCQRGHTPLVIERETFPRFHVGESLLPASQQIWERMGLAEALQHSGHTFKHAGEFFVGKSPQQEERVGITALFSIMPPKKAYVRPFAYQVERATFDKQVLDFAQSQGAQVRRGSVRSVLFDGEQARGVLVRQRDGQEREIEADFVIDASGRRAVIAKQLGLQEKDPQLKTSACFGHFRNVARDPGARQGYFQGYFIEHGWLWLIPLSDNRMSVGLVQNSPACDSWSKDPQKNLMDVVNKYRFIQKRFEHAEQTGPVRMYRDMAYYSRRMTGPGWAAVGDAAFFIDPLYSSGVHTAFLMGEAAAQAAHKTLEAAHCPKPLAAYEKRFRKYHSYTASFIRTVYRLLRTYWGAKMWVFWPGLLLKPSLNNWLSRRGVYFLSGFFEDYHLSVSYIKLLMNLCARAADGIAHWTGLGSWSSFNKKTNLVRALVSNPHSEVPKSKAQPVRSAKKHAAEPAIDAVRG